METIQQKRERRNAKALEIKKLLDDTPEGSWNNDCQKRYDELLAEVEAIDAAIAREQKFLDLSAEKDFKDAGGREIDTDLDNPENAKALQLHNKWLRKGDKALNEDDWAAIRNTMSTTTGSEGGYTVPTEVAQRIIEPLKDFSGMRKVADVIQTASGNPIQFPTSDGTAEEGEIIAENASASDADPDFGVTNLAVYKYSSKVITVPIELLQDSAVNVENFVNRRIQQRLGRITNKHFTTGTGTAQPYGAVTQASVGKAGLTGQATTVIYDDIVDLEHSVDVAYREAGGCAYMMHDKSVAIVKKLKDADGRPLWAPSIGQGQPATLNGYPVVINNNMAEMAANAKSILFGDFKSYTIRDVMALSLFRFTDSVYTKKGQVGFLAWMRSGGNLLDTAALKYYQNSAT